MSRQPLTQDEQRFRVTHDTTSETDDPHLIENTPSEPGTTLCGTTLADPQEIAGTTTSEQLPEPTDASTSDICTTCARRAHKTTYADDDRPS